MTKPQKFLIIRLSSLGDILHVLPAFRCLRKSFPEGQIDWLVDKRMQSLVSAIAGINQVFVIELNELRKAPLDHHAWRELGNLLRSLRAQQYDSCIDFQGLLKTAALSRLSGARERVGFGKDLVREWPAHWFYHRTLGKPTQPLHVAELNRRLAVAAGADEFRQESEIDIVVRDADVVNNLLREHRLHEFVVLNPGGGWPTKTWKSARYGVLAGRIQTELGLPVVVTTGPGEERLYEEIAQHCSDPKPYHFRLSFLLLIPLLQSARLFVGGDTGPFHLACAVDTPVVGIFGPTSPIRNGPWKEGEEAVFHKLPCSFCYGRTCPTQNECMDLSVDEVFAAVVRRLGSKP